MDSFSSPPSVEGYFQPFLNKTPPHPLWIDFVDNLLFLYSSLSSMENRAPQSFSSPPDKSGRQDFPPLVLRSAAFHDRSPSQQY